MTVVSALLCSVLWENIGIQATSPGQRFEADLTSGGSFAKKLDVFSKFMLGLAQ